jgi:hypothetical protein
MVSELEKTGRLRRWPVLRTGHWRTVWMSAGVAPGLAPGVRLAASKRVIKNPHFERAILEFLRATGGGITPRTSERRRAAVPPT